MATKAKAQVIEVWRDDSAPSYTAETPDGSHPAWRFSVNGKDFGPYYTRADAEAAAKLFCGSSSGVCSVPKCGKPVRRGQALCRKHWMAIAHWHRVQIGNAMTEEREAGVGPDEHGQYQSEEYKSAVAAAVESLKLKSGEESDAQG